MLQQELNELGFSINLHNLHQFEHINSSNNNNEDENDEYDNNNNVSGGTYIDFSDESSNNEMEETNYDCEEPDYNNILETEQESLQQQEDTDSVISNITYVSVLGNR